MLKSDCCRDAAGRLKLEVFAVEKVYDLLCSQEHTEKYVQTFINMMTMHQYAALYKDAEPRSPSLRYYVDGGTGQHYWCDSFDWWGFNMTSIVDPSIRKNVSLRAINATFHEIYSEERLDNIPLYNSGLGGWYKHRERFHQERLAYEAKGSPVDYEKRYG